MPGFFINHNDRGNLVEKIYYKNFIFSYKKSPQIAKETQIKSMFHDLSDFIKSFSKKLILIIIYITTRN